MIKVLVVDDDHLVRRGFISMMPWQAHGMEVVGEAGTGKKALEFLETNAADLLITDLAMPVMTGLELIKRVKELGLNVCTVVLTFHQDFELIQEALRLGALDYITKIELENEQMDAVLRRIVGRIQERYTPFDGGKSKEVSEERHVTVQMLQEIGELWSSVEWMVDDRAFEHALRETEKLNLPIPQLEKLFFAAANHWKRLLGDNPVYDRFVFGQHPWSEWVEWLESVRSAVRDRTETGPYSADVKASILKAADYIRRELHEDLQLPEVAKRVNMSRSYFSRCFHDIVGQTFNDYVREQRVGHAKILLRQTNKTIGWIAAQSGYPNEKYFCKVFRELTGLLPSEYRKREKGTVKT